MSDSIDCPHNVDGYCQISSDLAQVPVPIAQDACAACILQLTPRAKNSVTCRNAIQYRTFGGMLPTTELLECNKSPTHGLGTELETLIEETRPVFSWGCFGWLIPERFYCGFSSTKARMNELGTWGGLREKENPAFGILSRWIAHFPSIRFTRFVPNIIQSYIVRAVFKTKSKEKPNG